MEESSLIFLRTTPDNKLYSIPGEKDPIEYQQSLIGQTTVRRHNVRQQDIHTINTHLYNYNLPKWLISGNDLPKQSALVIYSKPEQPDHHWDALMLSSSRNILILEKIHNDDFIHY